MLIQKPKYLVGYDLRAPGRNYEDLWARLRQLGGVRILDSQWALANSASAMQIREDLRRFIDADDGLIVFAHSQSWASVGIRNAEQFEQIMADMSFQKGKYLIGYDLRTPGRNYEDLWGRLRQLGAVRILDSQWGLANSAYAAQIRDDLRRFLDANDGLIVFAHSENWASVGIRNTDQCKKILAA